MVMVGDSRSEGRGFESQHRKLDGPFSHIFVVKIVIIEKTKINEKEVVDCPFFKQKNEFMHNVIFVTEFLS